MHPENGNGASDEQKPNLHIPSLSVGTARNGFAKA
jgi:hypothetical protein